MPATYGVNSYLSLIYGGGSLASDVKSLVIIISSLSILAIGAQIVNYVWGRLQLQNS